jgi:cytochrome d ubiquinol oxidase subunit II
MDKQTTLERHLSHIYNAATGAYGLAIGVVWWTLGIILALGYFVFTYRMFRGKLHPGEEDAHGY